MVTAALIGGGFLSGHKKGGCPKAAARYDRWNRFLELDAHTGLDLPAGDRGVVGDNGDTVEGATVEGVVPLARSAVGGWVEGGSGDGAAVGERHFFKLAPALVD